MITNYNITNTCLNCPSDPLNILKCVTTAALASRDGQPYRQINENVVSMNGDYAEKGNRKYVYKNLF